MLRFLPNPLKLIISFLWAGLSTLVIGLTIIVLGLFKFLIPIPASQRFVSRIANAVFRGWAYAMSFMFRLSYPVKWQVEGDLPNNPNGWYLILSNHLSWVDILVMMHLSRADLPMPRFFLKQELFWVPVVGLGCWVLDMPFMKRYSKEQIAKRPELQGKDIETTREKCEKFRHIPTTVINFCEGTRLTPAKHAIKESTFRHLLPPKAGGTSFTLQAMGEQFQEVLDVTMIYPGYKAGDPIVGPLLRGELKEVYVHIDRIPVTPDLRGDYFNDPEFRERFQAWLNERWSLKDQRIENYLNRSN